VEEIPAPRSVKLPIPCSSDRSPAGLVQIEAEVLTVRREGYRAADDPARSADRAPQMALWRDVFAALQQK